MNRDTATGAIAVGKLTRKPHDEIFTITRRSDIAAMPDVPEVRVTAPAELLDLAPVPRPRFLPGATMPAPRRTLTAAEVKARRQRRRIERLLWVAGGACLVLAVLGLARLAGER